MKKRKRYVCKECGYASESWMGKCPDCMSWNSFIEEIIEKKQNKDKKQLTESKILNINDITVNNNFIIKTTISDVNMFFGEGIVQGSVILLSGEPGIGKSSFLLYLANIIMKLNKIFYFSGEESHSQIKKRTERINVKNDNLFISNHTEINEIITLITEGNPGIVFIDSIQTIYSNYIDSQIGSISQIKYCTTKLIEAAKEKNIPIILIGHVTKSGDIAGPKILEHMVDVVIYFQGDSQHDYRILKSIKNRFGGIDEILLFEMKENGLEIVENPSIYFIDKDDDEKFIGKCKTVIIEGRRPLIIELEALVVPSVFSNPRRFAEGADNARVSRIAAILDKYNNENLNNYDIYFNISGGVKTKDVCIDLAIAVAIFSSKNKISIPSNNVFIGELSLTGKIRNIIRMENRIKEANKFGINSYFIPDNDFKIKDIDLTYVNNITDTMNLLKNKK